MEYITTNQCKGWFYQAQANPVQPSWMDKIVETIPSDQATEIYAGAGAVPAMTEMQGGRKPSGLREFHFELENKEYESSIEIPSTDMRRDKTGQIQKKIAELSARADQHKVSLVSALIESGEAIVCYDGQYFFDETHSVGDSGSQSNLVEVKISELPTSVHGGAVTTPSPEEFALAALKGVEAILGFKDDKGQLINVGLTDFVIMAPLGLLSYGISAVYQGLQGYGATNIIDASRRAGMTFDFAVNPDLTWTDSIAVFGSSPFGKPYVVQDEDGPNFVALGNGSEREAEKRRHLYGVDVTRSAGAQGWDKACKLTFI
jgi:hypothetical protein